MPGRVQEFYVVQSEFYGVDSEEVRGYFHFHFSFKVCVPTTKLAIQTSSLCASAVSCVSRAPDDQIDQRCLDLLAWPSSSSSSWVVGAARWCACRLVLIAWLGPLPRRRLACWSMSEILCIYSSFFCYSFICWSVSEIICIYS